MITAVWGWSFVAKQQALHGISASALNACIFIVGALVLLPFAVKKLPGLSAKDWLAGILAGVVLFIAFAFQTSGLGHTTPSNAGFITGLSVVLTPLFLFLISAEKPLAKQALGAVVALLGLGFLSLNGDSIRAGDLLILGCAVFFALHIVVLAKTRFGSTSLVLAFIQLLTVGVLSLIWSVTAGEFSLPGTPSAITTTLIIAVLGTALAYLVQTRAQAVLPAQKVALLLVCEPIFAACFGYLLAGDRFTLLNMVGALMIVLGMLISELRLPRRRRSNVMTVAD
ncbi:DMT family transporter [Pseudomonas reidholzensis]|uniref:DMT family transporter n=1 Tax=Pseudomonas reidholzensis TaxID=1785162 RepID=UPI001ABEF4E5|nr:DMT family transporter [Pseudomonas reidholzensis]